MTQVLSKKGVKDYIRSKDTEGFRVSADFEEALNSKVLEVVDEAVKRMSGNKRRTLFSYDL